MALPVAQLGYMPQINLPNYIPAPQQQLSVWDKALAALLTGAAQQAGGQVVSNVLAKDFAPEAEQASWVKKIVSGPTVTREENARTVEAGRQAAREQTRMSFDLDQATRREAAEEKRQDKALAAQKELAAQAEEAARLRQLNADTLTLSRDAARAIEQQAALDRQSAEAEADRKARMEQMLVGLMFKDNQRSKPSNPVLDNLKLRKLAAETAVQEAVASGFVSPQTAVPQGVNPEAIAVANAKAAELRKQAAVSEALRSKDPYSWIDSLAQTLAP